MKITMEYSLPKETIWALSINLKEHMKKNKAFT